MKLNNRLFIFFMLPCFLTISFTNEAAGQINTCDSIQYQIAIKNTVGFYAEKININSPLYNGFDNDEYGPRVKGSAYFQDSIYFDKGTVTYNGVTYIDVPLLYDLYKDILISNLLNPVLKYSLVTQYVSKFQFNGHQFERITADTANLKTGFYEVAYANKLRVLIKREKNMQDIPGLDGGSNFENKVSYYLEKGTQYNKVSSQGDMIALMKDKKDAINKYINERKIKFKQDPVKAMVLLATYYDSLTN